jgi:superfamily II DNA helicase RecQ
MVAYCQSAQCRTRYILQYFGEPNDENWACERCDMCTRPMPTRRVTSETRSETRGETALSA